MRLFVATLYAIGLPAFAQTPQCAPVADVLTGLAANYGEAPRVTAMMGAHDPLERELSLAG